MPYSPGMRSSQIGNGGNIPLQDYADGTPPPPAPSVSWKRIDRWMEANYPELADELPDEATSYDLNELEADLECTLPLDVRDSFLIHDGQERGGRPCGLIFGLILLDLESVSEEWTHWKNTAVKISNVAKTHHANQRASQASAAQAGPSSAAPSQSARRGAPGPSGKAGKMSPNLNWLDHQESVPEGAIQRVYAHPGWIPLISDYLGNNIGIDLAPGPKGRWGQVIIFGREFDRKYVVAPSWAAFLMTFADDLENGNHLIVDETEVGELTFRASNGRLIPYLDVLKSRAERLERQTRKPAPGPYQAPPARRPGSQTNLAAASRISPRNSTTPNNGSTVPGRNVSGNFRRPNQVPTLPKDGRLISPMNSSTHLPSTGLAKPPSPLISTPKESPVEPKLVDVKPAEKTLLDETKDEPKAELKVEPKEDLKEEPKEESKKESKEDLKEEPKEESQEVSKEVSKEAPKEEANTNEENEVEKKELVAESNEEIKEATKEESKPEEKTLTETKKEQPKSEEDSETKPAVEVKEKQSDKVETTKDDSKAEFKISDADSDDEVDLLKDELSEVAI